MKDEQNGKVQVRGKIARLFDNRLILTTQSGQQEVILPNQLQYMCEMKTKKLVETGESISTSRVYINLIPYSDGIGTMEKLTDVVKELSIGDEIIIVGIMNEKSVVVSQLIEVIKC